MEFDTIEEYLKYFKGLSLKEKKQMTLESLKLMSVYCNKMCEGLEIHDEIYVNKDMAEVDKKDSSEEDYVEAVMSYIATIQQSLDRYNIGFSDQLDTMLGENQEKTE